MTARRETKAAQADILGKMLQRRAAKTEAPISAVALLSRTMGQEEPNAEKAASPAEKLQKRPPERKRYTITIGADLIPEQWEEGIRRPLELRTSTAQAPHDDTASRWLRHILTRN